MEGLSLARLKELLEDKVAKAPSMKELAPTKQEWMRRLGSICGVGPLDDDDAGVKCAAMACLLIPPLAHTFLELTHLRPSPPLSVRSRERLILEDEDLPLEFSSERRAPYMSPAVPLSQKPAVSSGTGDHTRCRTGLPADAAAAVALPESARKVNAPAPAPDGEHGTTSISTAATPIGSRNDEVLRPPSIPSAGPVSTGAGAAAAAASFPTTPPDSGAGAHLATEGGQSVGNGGDSDEESLPHIGNETDDLMAQVAWLEEQGRLVEASNLMAMALRRGAGGV
eukprot:scaffold19022_cov112-Isochrysis_galbana.AAC.1